MKRWWWLALLLGISIAGNGYLIAKDRNTRRVVMVIDGDTFELPRGVKVRLAGIDAPELGACKGEEATARLKELIDGKPVTLVDEEFDQFGRIMALVYVDGKSIDEQMLVEGLANIEYPGGKVNKILGEAYDRAKEAKLGIHSDECRQKMNTAQPDCVIKGNFDRSKWEKNYYLPSCPHYKTVIVNLGMGDKWFCTEKEAVEAGFALAEDCEE